MRPDRSVQGAVFVPHTVLSASVESLTLDPNPDNNFLQLPFHITGGHGFFPPG